MPEKPSFLDLEFKQFRDWDGYHLWQTVIFHSNGSLWWIKVEVHPPLPEPILGLGFFKRRSMLQEFIEAIDWGSMPLLDDIVTKITLTVTENRQSSLKLRDGYQTESNDFILLSHRMSCQMAEDPKRVTYPTLDRAQDLPTFDISWLKDAQLIAPTVSTVLLQEKRFAYKTIDRPIYEPGDAEHILDEIETLAQFRGQPNIAQLVGLVVSQNPYQSRPSTIPSPVITGFLLEYYPGGTLEQVLAASKNQDCPLLRRWALQIGRALALLHKNGRTHLDIKPSNIVFDAQKNAILIDIGGTDGYVWEWLSPEMQTTIQQDIETVPATTSLEKRVATDCFAYGRLLMTMAQEISTGHLGERLRSVADGLTKMDLKARVSLSEALTQLQDIQID